MLKLAHPVLDAHSADGLKRFEGGMDVSTLISIAIIGAAMLVALMTPGNLVPW